MGQAMPFARSNAEVEYLDALTAIESVDRAEDMPAVLQSVVHALGFDSYAYLDGATAAVDGGRVITTVSRDWLETYLAEGFAEHDPCTVRARASNAPFLWNQIPLGEIERRPTLAQKTMLTAREYGYVDGVILPLHTLDAAGKHVGNICSLFWKGSEADFRAQAQPRMRRLHLIAGGWAEKLATFDVSPQRSPAGTSIFTGLYDRGPKLRGREIDVLSWAARGKTAAETAVILGIGTETVTTHLANASKRLGATNKTHAVAIAVHRRLVRP
ncbi:helix-turn-helix transcriptional regulator [Methylobacterium radiotolerans]|uniref:helix-turn-helix transcriptional regulator n=1 Tax=Methylobacterium radiotolerans TaxID=31998 RepID=UPI0038D03AE5